MGKTKITKVYYYQISPKNELSISDKEAFLKKFDESFFNDKEKVFKKVAQSEGSVNLFDVHIDKTQNRYVMGTFVYNQNSNVPPIYDDKTKKPAKIKIGEYEGLGYDSSFLYDKTTRILALENKMPGTTPKSVMDFCYKNFDIEPVKLRDVVLPDEYKNFMNATDYTRIDLDLAIPDNHVGVLKPEEETADNLLSVMQELEGMNTRFSISNGRKNKKKKLSLEGVRQLAQWFYKNNKENGVANKIQITGYDVDSGSNRVFDLISKRLITTLEITKHRTIGNFQILSKYAQLKADFNLNKEKLEKLQIK